MLLERVLSDQPVPHDELFVENLRKDNTVRRVPLNPDIAEKTPSMLEDD